MPIWGGASRGAVVELGCPHCKHLQLRARGPQDGSYECQRCGKSFGRGEGEAEAALQRTPRS